MYELAGKTPGRHSEEHRCVLKLPFGGVCYKMHICTGNLGGGKSANEQKVWKLQQTVHDPKQQVILEFRLCKNDLKGGGTKQGRHFRVRTKEAPSF